MRWQHNHFEIFSKLLMSQQFIHFLLLNGFSIVRMEESIFISMFSVMDIWIISSFQLLQIKLLINIHLHIFFKCTHVFISFGQIPRIGRTGSFSCCCSVSQLSHVRLFVAPWTAAQQASLSFTISWSLLKLTSSSLVMPSNHLILYHTLLPPSIFSNIRVFSNEQMYVQLKKLLDSFSKQHQFTFLEVKASAYNVGDLGSIPVSGRSPGEGNGNPLQYSCLKNPMDRGAWWATVHGSQRVRHD